jgi:glycosyltransferase involved in cell wall biosynthesis
MLSDSFQGTGTWLSALAESLCDSNEIVVGNVSMGSFKNTLRQDYQNIIQWVLPKGSNPFKNGLPSKCYLDEVTNCIEAFSPDLIHIWGTESIWGLFTARKNTNRPVLLEMQGVKSAIAKVFNGGLTLNEQFKCIGFKEAVRGTTILQERKKFEKWGKYENEIIKGHKYIAVQSPWLEAQVRSVNNDAYIFHNEFSLQKPFYSSPPWRYKENYRIFCSTSYPLPFKGLHVAIRAVAILKKKYPNIQLRIAGAYPKKGLRQDGFVSWLLCEARRLGVESNLLWLGPLTVQEILDELQNCSANVVPTFVEGYCLALAEALYLGVPTAISFTGGTSYLAEDDETGLFFPPGDDAMCAYQLDRLLKDRVLAERLSSKSREAAKVRNDRNYIIKNQLDIYRNILSSCRPS